MISVIVPVYNVRPFLTEAIESVIAQSYTDWEMILVDDGSTDDAVKSVTHTLLPIPESR